ncbi:MAG: HutD family protein [Deltaproteobacteria bacterium]|nr:HutD family protein [Deltaproteobacteria bacterium]MDQ3300709.1 HutD family protein [Myxococcota bacterium]
MAARIITPADWRDQPWKNGLGVTREVARWPEASGAYDVRISVAEVLGSRSTAFSTFPGYLRWSTLLANDLLGLQTIDQPTHWLRAGQLAQYDGSVALSTAICDGAATLLNVLAKPDLIEVGLGAADAVDFVFAISAVDALPRWHARLFEVPATVTGEVLWLRFG